MEDGRETLTTRKTTQRQQIKQRAEKKERKERRRRERKSRKARQQKTNGREKQDNRRLMGEKSRRAIIIVSSNDISITLNFKRNRVLKEIKDRRLKRSGREEK